MYSPTTSAISSRSAAGYVYLLSSDGVRKQLTMTPFSGRGGYVPGTLRTTDEPPARVTRSQSRGSRIASLIAMKPPSYVWSDRLRKPYTPRSPGVFEDIMQDHAGTVIGGITEVRRPYEPRSMRPEMVGSSSRQRSRTRLGSAQSSPMSMTFRGTRQR